MSGAELLSPSPSSTTSKFIPSHADGTPITFLSGNKAEIPGYIHEFDLCCTRKGKFVNFAKFRGVLVKDIASFNGTFLRLSAEKERAPSADLF